MKNIKIRLKRKTLNRTMQLKEAINAHIQPFKEMPSVNGTGLERAGRMDAHDLFSHYTADVIREDIVYAR